jgi:hypothetical protein
MFSTLRNRFGIPGVISVMALVFAMFGGAYAASNSSDGGKATASAKAKKGPRGPKGATGPAGPAGPQGPAGPKGDAGASGSNGTPGTAGTNGTNGTSVTSEPVGPGPNCINGGVKFKSASPEAAFACNGANGANGTQGPKGDPWTAGGTLPVGSTEKGVWGIGAPFSNEINYIAPISFGVPLALPLDEAHAVFVPSSPPNPDPTHCSGSFQNPKSASGYLCVYEAGSTNMKVVAVTNESLQPGAGISGAAVVAVTEESNLAPEAYVTGTWAVTG